MAISVLQKCNVTTTEILTGDDLVANTTILHSGYDINRTLDASSTPNATKCAYQTVTMSGGAGTINLTSLLLNSVAVTFDGLKPRSILITALTGNSGNVTVTKAVSNGYDGMGSAFSVVLEPGQSFLFEFYTAGNAVSSSNRDLTLAGTGTDGVRLSTVAGT